MLKLVHLQNSNEGVFNRVKAKSGLLLITVLLATSFVSPVLTKADTLDDLRAQESELSAQADAISQQINGAMTEAEKTAAEIAELNASVMENQEKILTTQSEIETTKETIEKRKLAVADRLKDIQVSGTAEKSWQALLEADSVSDFVNRVYAMTVLQNAENDKIQSLNEEQAKLEDLEQQFLDTQNTLKANQASLEEKSASYIEQVNNLKTQLAENQNALSGVVASKEAEAARIAAEKEAAEKAAAEQAAAKAAAEQAEKDRQAQAAAANAAIENNSNNNGSSNSSTGGSSTPAPTPAPAPVESNKPNNSSNQGSSTGSVTAAEELAAKEWIAMKESSGSYTVYSVSGQHYGRYQLLLSYLGGDLSPANQEACADAYVAGRYGSWVAAKNFHLANGWY